MLTIKIREIYIKGICVESIDKHEALLSRCHLTNELLLLVSEDIHAEAVSHRQSHGRDTMIAYSYY